MKTQRKVQTREKESKIKIQKFFFSHSYFVQLFIRAVSYATVYFAEQNCVVSSYEQERSVHRRTRAVKKVDFVTCRNRTIVNPAQKTNEIQSDDEQTNTK